LVDTCLVVGYEGSAFVVDLRIDGGDESEQTAGLKVGVVGKASLVICHCAEAEGFPLVEAGVVGVVDGDDGGCVDDLHAFEDLIFVRGIGASDLGSDVSEITPRHIVSAAIAGYTGLCDGASDERVRGVSVVIIVD
jgi:hypothetical protein